jgi:DivIVA domain-containing protein
MITSNRGAYDRQRVLTPDQIRNTTFTRTWHGFGGYAPEEVRDHLFNVATAVQQWQTDLRALNEENARLKTALRQWQGQSADQRQTNQAAGRHAVQATANMTGPAVGHKPDPNLVEDIARIVHDDWVEQMRGHDTRIYLSASTPENRLVPFASLSEHARQELISTTYVLLGALPPSVHRVLAVGMHFSQRARRGDND